MVEVADSASESLLQEIDRPYIPNRNSRGNYWSDHKTQHFAYDQPVLGASAKLWLDKARKAYGDVWQAFERKRVGATEGDAGEYNRLNEEWEKRKPSGNHFIKWNLIEALPKSSSQSEAGESAIQFMRQLCLIG